MTDVAVLKKLLARADNNAVASASLGAQRQVAHDLAAEVDRNHVVMSADGGGGHEVDVKLLGGLLDEAVIGGVVGNGEIPSRVVEIRRGKGTLRRVAVVVFGEGGAITDDVGGREACVRGCFPACVADDHRGFILQKLQRHHMTKIARYPNAVDQTLIIGVNRDGIFSLGEKLGNGYLIIIIGEVITRGGTLGHKAAVDVQLVIIVCRNANHAVLGGGKVKFLSEKNVGVCVEGRVLGHGALSLAAKDRDRLASRKAGMGDAQGIVDHVYLL